MANIAVKTKFNTNLLLNTDSMGKRVGAGVIDLIVMALYVLLVIWILSFFDFSFDGLGGDESRVWWGISSLLSLPIIFYTLISEMVSGGYTIGKKLVNIKVVKLDGFQPGFVEYFVRWIFRVVDIWIILVIAVLMKAEIVAILSIYSIGLVGFISMSRSKKRQRVGDLVAGTAVIRDNVKQNINITILKEVEADYVPTFPQVLKLSDNDARIIKESFEHANKIRSAKMMRELVAKLEEVMNVKNDMPHAKFIQTVLKDFNFYTQKL